MSNPHRHVSLTQNPRDRKTLEITEQPNALIFDAVPCVLCSTAKLNSCRSSLRLEVQLCEALLLNIPLSKLLHFLIILLFEGHRALDVSVLLLPLGFLQFVLKRIILSVHP